MSARMKGIKRDLQRLLYELEETGWIASDTPGGHVKIQHPDYGFVICSKTASDSRSLKNLRGDIRRQIAAGKPERNHD